MLVDFGTFLPQPKSRPKDDNTRQHSVATSHQPGIDTEYILGVCHSIKWKIHRKSRGSLEPTSVGLVGQSPVTEFKPA